MNNPAYINNDNLRENARFGFSGIAVIQLLLAPTTYVFYIDRLLFTSLSYR